MTAPLVRNGIIGPELTTLFLHILSGTTTNRDLDRILDRAPSTIHKQLYQLRALGLVDWKANRSQGTLHPTVTTKGIPTP